MAEALAVTTLLLIRHARHDRLGRVLCGRMDGVLLGAAGRAEADALARALASSGLAALLSSPLARAAETAAPIAAATGLDLRTDPDLDEIDFGAWTGRGFDELQGDPAWTRWNALRGQSRAPGGESMLDVQRRVVAAMERVAAQHREAVVALVSHGDVIKAALAWALGLTLASHDRFEIDPASVSRLRLDQWGPVVLGMNETPHG